MSERGTDIVQRDASLVTVDDLRIAAVEVRRLVEDQENEQLDEVRKRAEAAALYETRKQNAERARHFWTLKILAEAGLGCIAFETPEIIPAGNFRNDCRVLAAAFERDKLLELCAQLSAPEYKSHNRGGSTTIVNLVRSRGYTYAPGKEVATSGSVPWRKARLLARALGKPLSSIPPDPGYVRRRQAQDMERERRAHRRSAAVARLERMERRKAIAAAAHEFGPHLDVAYTHLRKTLQSLHEAHSAMTREERGRAEDLFYYLYRLEDLMAEFLRVPGGET